MPVPHSGHLPFMALRPLAIVTSLASFMFRFALHFTQYASTAAAISTVVFIGKMPGLSSAKIGGRFLAVVIGAVIGLSTGITRCRFNIFSGW